MGATRNGAAEVVRAVVGGGTAFAVVAMEENGKDGEGPVVGGSVVEVGLGGLPDC